MTPREELLDLIQRFISGEDRSLELTGAIEGIVLEFFSDYPWFDNLSLALAQYSPSGGHNYLDADELAEELAAVAEVVSEP